MMRAMKGFFRYGRYLLLLVAFGFAAFLALKFRGNGLWEGLKHANAAGPKDRSNYDLTQVKVVNDTLKLTASGAPPRTTLASKTANSVG